MTRLLLGSAALLGALATFSAPASAQKIQRYIEVYGEDACPIGSDNEIVICARKPESDRYRIPERLRQPSDSAATETWATRAETLQTAGDSGAGSRGTGSCSPSGAGGWTGCWAEQMRKAKAEREAQQQQAVVPEP